jgi:protein phosphatase
MYRLRGRELEQMTHDHSLLQEQIDAGTLSREQARGAKGKNLLTRALGADPVVKADIRQYDAQAGDIFLLCSDGLTDALDEERITATLLEQGAEPQRCVAGLVDLANQAGGPDNITVALVRVEQAFPVQRGWWARLMAWFR